MNHGRTTIASVVMVVALAGLGGLCGCGEIEWWWLHQEPQRPVRPASKPISQRPAPSATAPSATTGDASAATASPPPPAAPAAPEEPGFHQLVLIRGASSETAGAGFAQVRLEHAPARAVGKLLDIFYIPSGPAGTDERYTLVYPTRIECQAAAEVARDLDAPPVDGPAGAAPQEVEAGWRFAVGLLQATPRDHADYRPRLELAETCFLRTLNDPQQPVRRRWAAGMIAGSVRGDLLNDYATAAKHLAQTDAIVPAGTLEHLVTRYALARAYIQEGQPDTARKLLTELTDRCRAFQSTEVFKRARETLDRMDRKRGQ